MKPFDPDLSRFPRAWRLLQGLLVALAGVVFVRTAWMSDDAYITLRSVDNFINGYGPRWNIAERVQSYTHPLWFLLESAAYAMTHEAFTTVILISLALSLFTVALLVVRPLSAPGFRSSPGGIVLAVLMLLGSRAFVDYSSSGLENPLTHLILAGFLLAAGGMGSPNGLVDGPLGRPRERRLLFLSLLAGLAALNRADSVLLFAPVLVIELRPLAWRDRGRILAAGFAPFLLWTAWATFYYGFPYPNTAPAKLRAGIDSLTLVRHGFYYLANSLRNDPLTLSGIALALGAALVRRRPRELAVAAGLALSLAWVVVVGGDFMSGRFLSAPYLAAVILLGGIGLRTRPRALLAGLVILLVVLTPYPPLLSGSDFGTRIAGLIDRHGISDERRFYFEMTGWRSGHGFRTRPGHELTKAGEWARRARTPLTARGAVGIAGYYAGPEVHIVDTHALCDPLLARIPMVLFDNNYEQGLAESAGFSDPEGWRIGHYLRNLPPGYLATLITGRNRIEEENLARFRERLRAITRDPLLNGRRLGLILRVNFEGSGGLVSPVRPPRNSAIPWAEIAAAAPQVAEPHIRMGARFLGAGLIDQAIPELEQALLLDPGSVETLNLLGQARAQKGDDAEAVLLWNRARAADPEDPAAYLNLGNRALALGDAEEAIPLFTRALQLNPRLAQAANNLGAALSGLGRREEALTWYGRALALRPGSTEIREDIEALRGTPARD